MEFTWLLTPVVRLLVLEAAPGLVSCRVCEIAVEDTLAAVVTHYWNEHPRATALIVVGALGISILATQSGGRRSR